MKTLQGPSDSCWSVTIHSDSLPYFNRSQNTHGWPPWMMTAALRGPLTLIAVSDRVKVHVILLVGEEEEAEPWVEGVDGDNEKDPDYVSLLVGRAIVTQVHVDLKGRTKWERSQIKWWSTTTREHFRPIITEFWGFVNVQKNQKKNAENNDIW